MGMVRFSLLFPEIAECETRVVHIFDPESPDVIPRLPADEYAMEELYCDEPGCDCQRVMINVLAVRARQHLATINHGFYKPARDELVEEQTFLDPLNRQSKWSDALLDLFVEVVLADEQYRRRLKRHYRMFKNVVDDASHPAHRLLRVGDHSTPSRESRRARSIPPPPPRRGKRRKWH